MKALARPRRNSLLESKVMDCMQKLRSPGWPGAHTHMRLFLLSAAGIKGMCYHAQLFLAFLTQSFTLYSRLALSSKQVSCLRFPSVGHKVCATTLSSFLDFRKFIWVNMINSKSLRYYNVKLKKKKFYLVFQIVFHSKSIQILYQ